MRKDKLNAVFVTGTDTGIGKTFISCLLLKRFNQQGLKTFGIKLIASGCHYTEDDCLVSDDALLLQQTASLAREYPVVNPIALLDPIAPEFAAMNMGQSLSKNLIKNCLLSSLQKDADINIIEGIGGWAVPLNERELLAEVIAELKIPVIMVVGIKLGCLNHALLSYAHIIGMNVPFIGWIANCIDPGTLLPQINILSLQKWIREPCLGIIPYNEDHNADNFLSKIDANTIQTFL